MEVFAFIPLPQYIYSMILNGITPLATPPQRIVSLVPSQTELLYHLGMHHRVVGITKFCIHPKIWHRTKTVIGGTKNIQEDKIKSCNPDLIIANKEENVKEQVEALATEYPVLVTDVANLVDALLMIEQVGRITHTQPESHQLAAKIRNQFLKIRPSPISLRTAYLIWQNPFMVAGGDTFINDMLQLAGLDNVFLNKTRYPVVSIDDIKNAGCELLLLSSEPYPFRDKHLANLQKQLPDTKILLADGEAFSWYGSRLLNTPAYLESLIKQLQ